MPSSVKRAGQWLLQRSENVAAAMMALMMLSFLYQIVVRYCFNASAPWAEEICVLMWVWGILWCSALVARPVDDIRIDLITVAVKPRVRRILEGSCSLILVVLFAVGLPGAWNYISFMKVESSPAIGIRFDLVFSVYILFAVAVISRQLWSLWQAIQGSAKQQYAEGREAAEI